MVIDYVLSKSQDDHGFIFNKARSSRYPAQRISDLDYADDLALLENSIELANEQLEKLALVAKQVGLQINLEKTEYMAFNVSESEGKVKLDNKPISKVNDFRYLGSMLASTENDVKRRCGLAWSVFETMAKIWTSSLLRVKLKVEILHASVFSILL